MCDVFVAFNDGKLIRAEVVDDLDVTNARVAEKQSKTRVAVSVTTPTVSVYTVDARLPANVKVIVFADMVHYIPTVPALARALSTGAVITEMNTSVFFNRMTTGGVSPSRGGGSGRAASAAGKRHTRSADEDEEADADGEEAEEDEEDVSVDERRGVSNVKVKVEKVDDGGQTQQTPTRSRGRPRKTESASKQATPKKEENPPKRKKAE